MRECIELYFPSYDIVQDLAHGLFVMADLAIFFWVHLSNGIALGALEDRSEQCI